MRTVKFLLKNSVVLLSLSILNSSLSVWAGGGLPILPGTGGTSVPAVLPQGLTNTQASANQQKSISSIAGGLPAGSSVGAVSLDLSQPMTPSMASWAVGKKAANQEFFQCVTGYYEPADTSGPTGCLNDPTTGTCTPMPGTCTLGQAQPLRIFGPKDPSTGNSQTEITGFYNSNYIRCSSQPTKANADCPLHVTATFTPTGCSGTLNGSVCTGQATNVTTSWVIKQEFTGPTVPQLPVANYSSPAIPLTTGQINNASATGMGNPTCGAGQALTTDSSGKEVCESINQMLCDSETATMNAQGKGYTTHCSPNKFLVPLANSLHNHQQCLDMGGKLRSYYHPFGLDEGTLIDPATFNSTNYAGYAGYLMCEVAPATGQNIQSASSKPKCPGGFTPYGDLGTFTAVCTPGPLTNTSGNIGSAFMDSTGKSCGNYPFANDYSKNPCPGGTFTQTAYSSSNFGSIGVPFPPGFPTTGVVPICSSPGSKPAWTYTCDYATWPCTWTWQTMACY